MIHVKFLFIQANANTKSNILNDILFVSHFRWFIFAFGSLTFDTFQWCFSSSIRHNGKVIDVRLIKAFQRWREKKRIKVFLACCVTMDYFIINWSKKAKWTNKVETKYMRFFYSLLFTRKGVTNCYTFACPRSQTITWYSVNVRDDKWWFLCSMTLCYRYRFVTFSSQSQ